MPPDRRAPSHPCYTVPDVARLSTTERAALSDRSFAYVDSAGVRRLPIHDESHVRNALARFGQVRFESDAARDRARTRLLQAARKHRIVPVGFIAGSALWNCAAQNDARGALPLVALLLLTLRRRRR